VITDQDLNGDTLVAAAEPLLVGEAIRGRMTAAARRFGRPDAAQRVAALMLSVAGLAESPRKGAGARPDRAEHPSSNRPTTTEEHRQ
jgi:hypothetical protein